MFVPWNLQRAMLELVDRFRQYLRFLSLLYVCAMESSAYDAGFSSTDIVSIIDIAVFISVLSTLVIYCITWYRFYQYHVIFSIIIIFIISSLFFEESKVQ